MNPQPFVIPQPHNVPNRIWKEFLEQWSHCLDFAETGNFPTDEWGHPDITSQDDFMIALKQLLACLHRNYTPDPCPECNGRLMVIEDSAHCLDCDYSDSNNITDPDPDAAYEQECDRHWEASPHADAERTALTQFAVELQYGGGLDDLGEIA